MLLAKSKLRLGRMVGYDDVVTLTRLVGNVTVPVNVGEAFSALSVFKFMKF
jgi:hypothetical protein